MALSDNLTRKLQITLADNDAGQELVTAVNALIAGTITSAQTITSSSATAFVVGPNGTTNPTFKIDASVTSAATGLKITGRAAGSGVTIASITSGTDEDILVAPAGAGGIKVTTTSANGLAVGRQGSTTPVLTVDCSATTVVTGLKITGAAAASGVALQVTSSGSNEALTIDAKAAALITLAGAAAGATGVQIGSSTSAATAVLTVQSTNASALAVGRQGATNPGLTVDASTSTCVTGLKVTALAAGNGVTVAVTSSGAAEKLVVQCKSGSTNSLTLNDTLAAASSPLVQLTATDTTTGNVTDGYTGGLEFAPIVAGANTVTRLNYVNVLQPTGAATITNACLFRFNAAAGTHKAVDGATTKTTPGGVDAWVKVNVNGVVYFIPAYTSKTA